MNKKADSKEAQYFNEMMVKFKEKMSNATKAEQQLILSVLPNSFPSNKIQEEFNVSRHFNDSVRKIVAEYGILAPLQPKCGKSLKDDTIKLIEQFYTSDEISRAQPGIRDFVIIRVNNTKTMVIKCKFLANKLIDRRVNSNFV